MSKAMTKPSQPTVLIVEDEDLVRDIAVTEFEDAGYAVLEAADSATAIALLSGPEVIDLLFTDIRLPGTLDGWGIAAKARVLRPEIAVIYATGFSADDPKLVPGSRFFKKPYFPVAVIEAARGLGVG